MEDLKKIIEVAISRINSHGEVKYRLVEMPIKELGHDLFVVEIYSSEFLKPIIRETYLAKSEKSSREKCYMLITIKMVEIAMRSAHDSYKSLSETNPQQFF